MTAAVDLAAVTLEPAGGAEASAELRPMRRVLEQASGLLMLLDEHRITGQLPRDARQQASRLRHALKLAVQAAAASSQAAMLAPRPTLHPAPDPAAAALRAWIAAQPWAQPGPTGWVYLLCFRDPATGQHRPLHGNGCRGQYAGHYWGWTTDLVRRIGNVNQNWPHRADLKWPHRGVGRRPRCGDWVRRAGGLLSCGSGWLGAGRTRCRSPRSGR